MNYNKSVFLDFITRNKCYNENDIQEGKVKPCIDCSQYYPHPYLFYVFVEGSNKMEQQPLKNYTTSMEPSMKEKSNVKFSKAPEPTLNGDFDHSNQTSHSLNLESDKNLDLESLI